MYPDPAPLVVWLGIPAVALAVAVMFVLGVRRAAQAQALSPARISSWTVAAGGGVSLWAAAFGVIAASGWMLRTDATPPPFALVVSMVMAGAISLGASKLGGALARGLPFAALVGFHAFRFPLELVMHAAAGAGVMPPQMSWNGLNFDVVTGVSAIGVAALAARNQAPRALLWAWNILGTALVFAVAVVAALSSPQLHKFGPDAVNVWVAYVPFIWLPAICVAGAIAGHVVIFRKLLAR